MMGEATNGRADLQALGALARFRAAQKACFTISVMAW
jgi:hypothetical protein